MAVRKQTKTDHEAQLETCGPARFPGDVVQNVVKHVTSGCSVEFGRDAKGTPKWTLKMSCEREELGEAVTELLALDRRLTEETADHGEG